MKRSWGLAFKIVGVAAAGLLLLLTIVAFFLYENLERFVPPNLIPPASHWVNENKPLREQTVRVEIADRTFEIPQMYIDSKMPLSGVIKDSVLLEVIWPDMRSIHELKDRAEYEQIWKHERRLGWILLESASARPTLDEQVTNRRQGLTKEEYIGTENGLEKYLWYHGLLDEPKIWAEMYIGKNESGKVVTRIECRLGAGVRFPMCSHKFVDGNLIWQISYNKNAFFHEWPQQMQRAAKFVNSMETIQQ